MNSIKQKFLALTEREQRLVIISVIVVVLGAFYWGIWSPLNKGISQQQQLVENNKKLAAWVEQQAIRANQLRGATGTPRQVSGALPQVVSSTSANYSLTISRMQPQGDEIQVWLDEAPFNNLIGWLSELEAQGVVIKQVDVSEASDAGKVKIRRLVLNK